MGGEEVAEPRQQPVRREDRNGGDPEPLAARPLSRQGPCKVAEGAPGGRGEQPAGSRQRDTARLAVEQLFAQGALEAGDAVTDRRGRDVELFGRRLERARARRQLEGLQREQVARRQGVGGVFRQNASADSAITVAAPALIWWLSEVVCGSTRAR